MRISRLLNGTYAGNGLSQSPKLTLKKLVCLIILTAPLLTLKSEPFLNGPFVAKTSLPVWVIPLGESERKIASLPPSAEALKIRLSNNNLSIKIFKNRLYFAFRSASHHHPSPPIWSSQFLTETHPKTEMYLLSAPITEKLGSQFETEFPKIHWKVELHVRDTLADSLLIPMSRNLVSDNEIKSAEAKAWFARVLGEGEAQNFSNYATRLKQQSRIMWFQSQSAIEKQRLDQFLRKFNSLLVEFDLREPFFLVLNGKLHFYFQQIESKSMSFHSLRTWHLALDAASHSWSEPQPILAAKEHFWDIQVKKEGSREMAYLTSYSGGHYAVNEDSKFNSIHFRKSPDGVVWNAVDNKESVYRGGASEAGFVFVPQTRQMFASLRLDDGDALGWGSLLAQASWDRLSDWKIPPRADPRRFDSPRLFTYRGEIYLLARQNICLNKNNELEEDRNCAFDREFVGVSEKSAEKKRETILGKIKNKALSLKNIFSHGAPPGVSLQYEYIYYFHLPKRTALYWLNPNNRRFQRMLTLPSAGDTGFPSVEPLGNGEFLVANYSSDPAQTRWSWRTGQQNPTGIYFLKLSLRPPERYVKTLSSPSLPR